MNSKPRKRFGQHFLIDTEIIRQIVSATGVQHGDHVLEIGPGRGAITGPILETGASVTAVEIDRDLAEFLENQFSANDRFRVFQNDILKTSLAALNVPTPLRIVGNLPYNISSPLILHLLNHLEAIAEMTFMLQKEVVDRLAASPNSKAYGRLSVIVQSQAEVNDLIDVPPLAFDPPPKVDSAVVRITPQLGRPSTQELQQLQAITRIAFGQRRKALKNTLGKVYEAPLLARAGIDTSLRAEDIHVAEYVQLARFVTHEFH